MEMDGAMATWSGAGFRTTRHARNGFEGMKISEWLDAKEKEGLDVAHISLPGEMSYDEVPEETLYFKEIRPCSILCAGNHPFATVERFGHWYYSRGQDKRAGIHASGMKWWLFTRDKELALRTAQSHIEP
jgi:hypothetical protein